ncbi:hypothetical protein [Azohydromonas lata]|uniref:hypothetical protein n=1 Tax=Azohydromonas lata TaxID=45677 RepID=UPI00082CF4E3|nr:hypothetical protein [Azohydromonas lata]
MNADPVLAGFDKFMSAVRGIEPQHIAQALNAFTPGTDWRKCSKYRMAECYGLAMADKSPGVFDQPAAALRQLDLAALAMRAQACAEGHAGWSGLGAAAGVTPPPTAAEIAAEVFKAPVLASMRQELHAVSRSLLRTEDKLRAALQRVKALQEHNAALVMLVEQAAVPGGISEHEFSRPGGWRDRALRLACQTRSTA